MTDDVQVGTRRDAHHVGRRTMRTALAAGRDAPTTTVAGCDGSARDAAASICRIARRLPDVDFVAVLGIGADARVTALAALGPTSEAGTPAAALDIGTACALLGHTASEAWVAPAADVLPTIGDAPDGPLVCAAMRDRGELVGILAFGAVGARAGDATDARLTLVAELSTVAAALVGRALDADVHRNGRARLVDVIRERAFRAVFQPIVELADRSRVGYEALARFDDNTPVRDRVEHAARVGLGADLERAVLEVVVDTSARLPGDGWLSIDVSPASLCSGDDIPALLRSIERPVVVELTERAPIEDYAPVRAAMRALGRGARVAVDDVGSGDAGLRHVLALHPAFVKLDPAWVRGVEHDAARQALIAGLGYFAAYTGCRLVGTGVETEHEAEALAGLGVTLGQGPLFGAPRALRRRPAPRQPVARA